VHRVVRRQERDRFRDRKRCHLDDVLTVGRVGRRLLDHHVGRRVRPERQRVRQMRTVGLRSAVVGAVGADSRERAGPAGAGLLDQFAVDGLVDRLTRLARAAGQESQPLALRQTTTPPSVRATT